jgi:hypothetical protein
MTINKEINTISIIDGTCVEISLCILLRPPLTRGLRASHRIEIKLYSTHLLHLLIHTDHYF